MESRFASRRELQQALLAWRDVARVSAGIVEAHVYEDVVAVGTFGLEVGAVSADALERHVQSDAFGSLVGALNVLAEHVRMSISELTTDFGPGSFAAIRRICLEDDEGEPAEKSSR